VILAVGSHGTVQKIQHHKNSKDHNSAVNMRQKLFKPVKDTEQEENLYSQKDKNQSGPAEDHPEYPLSALF